MSAQAVRPACGPSISPRTATAGPSRTASTGRWSSPLRDPRLDEVLDLEPAAGQEPDPVAVAEVELDRAVGIRPLRPAHAEHRAPQPLGDGILLEIGAAQVRDDMVGEEREPATRPQKARGLRDPCRRIRPESRAVLADREVERGIGERHAFGVAQDQREVQGVLTLEPDRGLQLSWRVVDRHHPRPPASHPGGDVAGAAAELDGVLSREIVGQHPDDRFGHPVDPPRLLAGRLPPRPLAGGDVVARVPVPGDPVRGNVVRKGARISTDGARIRFRRFRLRRYRLGPSRHVTPRRDAWPAPPGAPRSCAR